MGSLTIRDAGRPQRVLLVGFQDQDNLGLRYLCSAVRAAGHEPDVLTFDSDPRTLIDRARATRPDVIGLSLIFQYMTPTFADVIAAVREAGIEAHVTLGGHYPSFHFGPVLDLIPGLDSVVRFDGEVTLSQLLHRLAAGADWRDLHGLAFRGPDGRARSNCLREPVADLDELPWPERSDIDYEANPLPTASILGSRGCPWNCSFCSIRPFYEEQGGKLRRLRSPENVVSEMLDLHDRRGVPLFLFQDDDFLAIGQRARDWAGSIADQLADANVAGRLAFKMSCRSDEVREDVLRRLMRGGLTHVYMGVESGDRDGLVHMNKLLKPEAHLRAAQVLKSLGLSFDFGFMLMDPSSTFASIRSNIAFLDAFVGDGWSIAPFCRMLPYAGTPLRDQLAKEGRLRGTDFQPDYEFLDPKLDLYYDWMIRTFHRRNFTSEGLCHILRYLMFEARLRLDGFAEDDDRTLPILQFIVAQANRVALRVLEAGLDYVQRESLARLGPADDFLQALTRWEATEEERLLQEIAGYMSATEARRSRQREAGGFDRTWTFGEKARETLGVGAA
jgi:anaerobic magnesium-protoporphyrin IX monomethyl ester cyclase